MDSVENIRKNRRKLFMYSIILLIVGLFLGYSITYLLKPKEKVDCVKTATINDNSNNVDNTMEVIAENLLKYYTDYYNEILINDEKITYEDRDAYQVINSFKEINDLFTSDITLDELYNYYDYGNSTLTDVDSNKPVYTQLNDLYYFDGVCDEKGNKLMYSDFKVLNKTNNTTELSYKITIMSIVDDSIMETNYEDRMIIKLEDGSWKINKASIIGRCGLPYEIG